MRYYLVSYTRMLAPASKGLRLRATNIRMNETDLKSILDDASPFQFIVEKATLVEGFPDEATVYKGENA